VISPYGCAHSFSLSFCKRNERDVKEAAATNFVKNESYQIFY
jgi:hypothetical protein